MARGLRRHSRGVTDSSWMWNITSVCGVEGTFQLEFEGVGGAHQGAERKTGMLSRQNDVPSSDAHVLILRTCRYVAFSGKRDLANLIKAADFKVEKLS